MCDPKKCESCVREDLADLTLILSNILDIERRFTWSERAVYKRKIDDIHNRLKKQADDVVSDK